MRALRSYRWRLRKDLGGHPLDQVFITPEQAGDWRRETYGDAEVPITLMVLDQDGDEVSPTDNELRGAYVAWSDIGA